jgi:hypothetical protein
MTAPITRAYRGGGKEVTHMKYKIVLTVLLCLATATLGIGAVPALAADGCDCHTVEPLTAPTPHAPYVASVTDCTTCHVDWTVPHPASWRSILSLFGRSTDTGYRLRGWVGVHIGGLTPVTKAHPGVVLYLQQRLWGATEFTDLTKVTTNANGNGVFTVASPPAFATYRAVSQGHVGVGLFSDATFLFRPRVTLLLPTPGLTLELRGLKPPGLSGPANIRLGRTITVHGAVAPPDLGGKITIRVQKSVHRHWVEGVLRQRWVTPITRTRAISDIGTYDWKWTPRTRGHFRVFAVIPATAAHRGAMTRVPPLHFLYDSFVVR